MILTTYITSEGVIASHPRLVVGRVWESGVDESETLTPPQADPGRALPGRRKCSRGRFCFVLRPTERRASVYQCSTVIDETTGERCHAPVDKLFWSIPVCEPHIAPGYNECKRGSQAKLLNALRETSPDLPASPGHTYILLMSDGFVKVGTSIRLADRLRALRRENGPLQVLAVLDGGIDVECDLHTRFSALRVASWGERFHPDPEIIQYATLQGICPSARSIVAEFSNYRPSNPPSMQGVLSWATPVPGSPQQPSTSSPTSPSFTSVRTWSALSPYQWPSAFSPTSYVTSP